MVSTTVQQARMPPGRPESGRHHRKKPSSHHDSASSLPPPPTARNARREIWLYDIDGKHHSLTLSVKASADIASLEATLRARRQPGREPIPEGREIRFYARGRQLRPDEAASSEGTIGYKIVAPPPSAPSAPAIVLAGDNVSAESNLERLLRDEAARGATVGELRASVASRCGIGDPRRIALVARGGLRRGPIEGEAWLAKSVLEWRFRALEVKGLPEDRFLVVRLSGRAYLFHPSFTEHDDPPSADSVKSWVKDDFLRTVLRNGRSRVTVQGADIGLTRNGEQVQVLGWGDSLDCDLPSTAAERFADEEGWLLANVTECAVCCEPKKATDMPLWRVTAACDHTQATCRACLRQWIETSMASSGCENLRCPDCPSQMQHDDVRRHASRKTFARYDQFLVRATLRNTENFHWCFSPTCGSGQISNDHCPRFTCHNCGRRHCTRHQVPWHAGESCDDYDRRNQKQKRDEAASEDTVRKTCKPCPKCKTAVHKYAGCNHITCTCHHEWCYLCLEPYLHDATGMIYCHHKEDCPDRELDNGPLFEAEFLADDGARDGPRRVHEWQGRELERIFEDLFLMYRQEADLPRRRRRGGPHREPATPAAAAPFRGRPPNRVADPWRAGAGPNAAPYPPPWDDIFGQPRVR